MANVMENNCKPWLTIVNHGQGQPLLEKYLPHPMQSCRECLTPFPHADLLSMIDKSKDKNKYFSTCTHLESYTTCVYAGFSTIARVHRDLC
jgi:hypothetical protein